VFSSTRNGRRNLYQKLSSGTGDDELLVESQQNKTAGDWSVDGQSVLYSVLDDPKTGRDVWVLPLTGDRKPFAFLNASFDERLGQFSPDGRWVAYGSNESGRQEIYVRPFPKADAQWQVSTGGGIWPRWRPDGKELYYIAPDGTLMAAVVDVTRATFESGAPEALFQTRIVGSATNPDLGRQYDVARDGRFLINVAAADATGSPITVILNWAAGAMR
jgi:Tol biopolymer transport system component